MITEWLLGLAVWLGELVLGMLPEDQSADLVANAAGAIAGVVGMASGISAWVPWAVIGIVGAATYSMWAATFTLKIVRQLIAHVPQFGGAG